MFSLSYRLTFGAPGYLLLLAVLPALWWLSFRSLRAFGLVRRWAAIGLRTLVILAIVLALAEAQMVQISDRLTVLYLLDQSLSIPEPQRRAMIDYVNKSVKTHRKQQDRAGVIVFGREPAIEVPPFDDDVQMAPKAESPLDPQFTNLAAALRLAQASFPEDASKRVVIVSDGNENLGDVLEQARALAGAGVGIDVVPVRYQHQGEVMVERVTMPNDLRRGEPFDLRIVLNNTRQASAKDAAAVSGRLVVKKSARGDSVVISDERTALRPGKQVFTLRQQLDASNFYTYEAAFYPDRPQDDTMAQNNRATAFAHVRGKGQVLVIEDSEAKGQYDRMVEALRRHNLEVVVMPSDQLFTTLAELQQFDTVVLANVPREQFTDAQIQMLVRNTQQMGAGLVMMGAPNGFGAGGWVNTELEKAMPVDFEIQSTKVVLRGALAMIMHASEMADGNFWQKKIAAEALNALGGRDYCGMVHYGNQSGRTEWLWNPGMLVVGPNRNQMLVRLNGMVPGDMPDFDPGMVMGLKALAAIPDAAVKHMIIISDGDPSPPTRGVLAALKEKKITVATVGVGTHGPAESRTLSWIADSTGGKFYRVNDARMLPRIFQREARRVTQPLLYTNDRGVAPRINQSHEMLGGISGSLPPIKGFVLTTKKDNPLVEVSAVSPQPPNEKNATILASWTYGLGRAVAFTTDAGFQFAHRWTGWENYDKFFGQMIRWSMRPTNDEGKFSVASDVEDGQVRVVITALDKNDEFLNFLDVSGGVVRPDLKAADMKLEQTAPGRYVGTFPAQDAGSYMILISPGPGKAPIRTGVNVPYSDEFRGRPPNEPLLEQLGRLTPKGGSPGRWIDAPENAGHLEALLSVDTFRHDLPKATSSQDIWHYLVLWGSCLFFCDVFVRRVQVGFAWVPALVGRVLRRQREAPQAETIERLRSRKAEVSTQLDQIRSNARFEAPPESTADASTLEELAQPPAAGSARSGPAMSSKPEEESYTERLLKAKKKAWEGKKKDGG
jgi:hypothetical protein